jgi:peptidoglycan L-alanyl-D-glutamate endopeptidase CwlK
MAVPSKAWATSQGARLASVRPELAAAYAVALRRWLGDPLLVALGQPFVSEGYRSGQEQDELYTHGRSAPGPIVTYKRGGESKHNALPSRALDVAFLLSDGTTSWSADLLGKFARLMKAADARVHWGGDWPGFKDRPHFEV